MSISRDETHVKFPSVCVLMLLLAIPPIVNALAVGVTLESEQVITFAQANFGLHLAFAQNRGMFKKERIAEHCFVFPVEALPYDAVTASLLTCTHTLGPVRNPDGEREAGIALLVVNGGRFMVQVSMGTRFWERHYMGFVKSEKEERFLLRADAGRKDGGQVVKKGMEKILDLCGSNLTLEDSGEIYVGKNVEPRKKFVIGRKEVPCLIDINEEVKHVSSVFREIDKFLTVSPTEKMMVRALPDNRTVEEFIDLGDEVFLRRRTRVVGTRLLAILTGFTIVARVLVGLVTNNDANDGIERMVKERVGLEFCESMLEESVSRTVIRYDLKQNGRVVEKHISK